MAEVEVICCAGQSNAVANGTGVGNVPSNLQTPDAGIKIWDVTDTFVTLWNGHNNDLNDGFGGSDKWGPEAEFTRLWRLDHPSSTIYVVKFALTATRLAATPTERDWSPTSVGELFDTTQTHIENAFAELVAAGHTPRMRAALWMQGESDSLDSTNASAYGTNLTAFITAVRSRWGDSSTRFIAGRISNSTDWTFRTAVRSGQASAIAAASLAALVDTDGYPLVDGEHYGPDGQVSLGADMYAAYSAMSGVSTAIKIMPLGDSITQGQDTTYGSYRRQLYSLLTARGITVDFVGAYSNGSFPEPQHYGVTGDVINGTWGLVATGLIIEAYTPDIILLLIGTNDVWHGDGDIPAKLVTYGHLLDSIASHGPTVRTIVGSIPPIDVAVAGATVAANVDVFNQRLYELVASRGGNFSFVDLNSRLTTSDLADGVHPTNAGNDLLAPAWEAGVREALGLLQRFSTLPITLPFTDARARTTPDRLTDVTNICDFGADPTGVADSLPAFNLAIKAARARVLIDGAIAIGRQDSDSKNAGIIWVPPGKYLVSDTVEIIPGAAGSGGYSVSFTLMGDNAGSTMIFGNVNGFIIDTGYASGMTGGFLVEGLSVYNYNTTAYSSGAIYNGGSPSCTRECVVFGMVGLAVQSLTCFNGGCYSTVFLGPGFGINSLGLSQTTDASICSACYFTNWDIAHIPSFDAPVVMGNVYEKNRIAVDIGGVVNQGFQGNPASGFGAGHIVANVMLGNTFISNGVSISGTHDGLIAGAHIDCTPATGISGTDNVQYGIDFLAAGHLANVSVTGGPIDHFAYNIHGGGTLTGIGLQTDVPYAQRWSLPGNIGATFPDPEEAKRLVFFGCDINPVWRFANLPWGQINDGEIVGTTLTFSGYFAGSQFQYHMHSHSYIIGAGVAVPTKTGVLGTTFHNAIIDSGDGTGADGTVLTFTGYTGPAPITGASLQIQDSIGTYLGSGTVDNGSGDATTVGNVFTNTHYNTLTGATISNGSGGAGDILAYTSFSDPVYNTGNQMILSRVAIGISGAGGIPRDTFIIAKIGTDGLHWQLNRSLHIPASGSTTMYVLPDFRPGYIFNSASPLDSLGRTAPLGSALVTELNLNQWTTSGSPYAYGPIGPLVILNPFSLTSGTIRALGSPISSTQWHITGADVNIGISEGITLPDTVTVDNSQAVGPVSMIFIVDVPGNSYEVSDASDPAWTGSVSNVGKTITATGSNRAKIRFEETKGWIIAG